MITKILVHILNVLSPFRKINIFFKSINILVIMAFYIDGKIWMNCQVSTNQINKSSIMLLEILPNFCEVYNSASKFYVGFSFHKQHYSSLLRNCSSWSRPLPCLQVITFCCKNSLVFYHAWMTQLNFCSKCREGA